MARLGRAKVHLFSDVHVNPYGPSRLRPAAELNLGPADDRRMTARRQAMVWRKEGRGRFGRSGCPNAARAGPSAAYMVVRRAKRNPGQPSCACMKATASLSTGAMKRNGPAKTPSSSLWVMDG